MIKRAIVIVFIHNDNCEVLAIDFVLYLETHAWTRNSAYGFSALG